MQTLPEVKAFSRLLQKPDFFDEIMLDVLEGKGRNDSGGRQVRN